MEDPPRDAIEQADVVFHAWPAGHGEGMRLRQEKGQRWIGFGDVQTIERFCGEAVRFPLPLLARIITKTRECIEHAGVPLQVHITDPKGTDLSFAHDAESLAALWRDPRWNGRLVADEPGARAVLPPTHGPNILAGFGADAKRSLNGHRPL